MIQKKQLKKSEYTLSVHNIKKIIYSTDNFRNRLIIKGLYYGGMRRFEISNLEVKDIDFENERITVIGKGNKQREIPNINNEFFSDLKHYVGKRNIGYMFPIKYKEKIKPISVRSINIIVRNAGIKAEVNHPDSRRSFITPHLFRHSIARHLKDNEFNMEFIQKFLGHSSYKTTMDMYGTLSINDLSQIAKEKKLS